MCPVRCVTYVSGRSHYEHVGLYPAHSDAFLANLIRYTRIHAIPRVSNNRHTCSADLRYLPAP
jgi:hypothetical protein